MSQPAAGCGCEPVDQCRARCTPRTPRPTASMARPATASITLMSRPADAWPVPVLGGRGTPTPATADAAPTGEPPPDVGPETPALAAGAFPGPVGALVEPLGAMITGCGPVDGPITTGEMVVPGTITGLVTIGPVTIGAVEKI